MRVRMRVTLLRTWYATAYSPRWTRSWSAQGGCWRFLTYNRARYRVDGCYTFMSRAYNGSGGLTTGSALSGSISGLRYTSATWR